MQLGTVTFEFIWNENAIDLDFDIIRCGWDRKKVGALFYIKNWLQVVF